MRAAEIRKLLKAQPFQPLRLALSDGCSVLIRHPDQAVVTNRHVFVGLARIEGSAPLATPRSGDVIARDWMFVNVLQITAIEPADRNKRKLPPKRPKQRKRK